MFGYEAKMHARRLWGADDEGRPRKKHGAWRDAMIRWIDQKQALREATRQRRHLHKIEVQRLKAEGKSDLEAARDAERLADQMVDQAAEYKHTGTWQKLASDAEPATSPALSKRKHHSPVATVLDLLLGGRARFVVGALLLAIYALWVRQNDLWQQVHGDAGLTKLRHYLTLNTKPVSIPLLSLPETLAQLLSTHGVGVAGLLILASAFRFGRRATFFMLPAVIVAHRRTTRTTGPIANTTNIDHAGGHPRTWRTARHHRPVAEQTK